MAKRSTTLREAAGIVFEVGDAHREGEYGDEMTSRDIRDAIYTAAQKLQEIAAEAEAAGA